jgi:transcriptional regulator with XRE-family HTH domain
MAASNVPDFGARLRELRERAGLTQVQLAELASMHPQGIVKLERGEREPGWSTLLALAGALGVSLDTFAAESLPPPEGPIPKSARGRPRKDEGVEIDLHTMESAPLESVPGPTPTKKGRGGRLPEVQEKPKERKARRPRGG